MEPLKNDSKSSSHWTAASVCGHCILCRRESNELPPPTCSTSPTSSSAHTARMIDSHCTGSWSCRTRWVRISSTPAYDDYKKKSVVRSAQWPPLQQTRSAGCTHTRMLAHRKHHTWGRFQAHGTRRTREHDVVQVHVRVGALAEGTDHR